MAKHCGAPLFPHTAAGGVNKNFIELIKRVVEIGTLLKRWAVYLN